MKKLFIVIFCLFFCALNLYGFDKVFLQTARITGTGGAVTAAADDLSTAVFNPASLSHPDSIQIAGDVFNLYQAGLRNTLFGLYYPLFFDGGVGFLWNRTDYEKALNFNNFEDTYYLIFAKKFIGANWGITGKYLREELDTESVRLTEQNYEIDFGCQKQFKQFNIGISILNVILLFDNKNVPSIFTFGISGSPLNNLYLLLDYRNVDKENEFSVGIEYNFIDELIFRAGWYVDFYFAAGLSYTIRRFRIDYSFSISQYNIGTTHYFSVLYNFAI